MHIALFTDCFDLINGVCTTYNAMVKWALQTRALTLTVFTPSHTDHVTTHNNVKIVRLKPNVALHPPKYDEFQSGLITFRRIREHLTTPPDLIHIATSGPFGVVGGCFARWTRIPMVGFYHTDIRQYGSLYGKQLFKYAWPGKLIGQVLARAINHIAYGACQHMFVQTESYKQEAQNIAHCPVQIVPTGIDTDLFCPPMPIQNRQGQLREQYLKDKSHLAIFVGRLAIEKNIPFLIQCYTHLKDADIQLVLVGDGPLRKSLPSDIPVTGYLSGKPLQDAYHSADFLILPSHTDTIGLVVLEAMATGLPVVCSPIGGPAEIVRQTGAGTICATQNPQNFTKACRQIVNNPIHWLTLATRAHTFGQNCTHANSFEHMMQGYYHQIQSHLYSTPTTRTSQHTQKV